MGVNFNLPKVATQWNSGATRESNRIPSQVAWIPSALTTKPLSLVKQYYKMTIKNIKT